MLHERTKINVPGSSQPALSPPKISFLTGFQLSHPLQIRPSHAPGRVCRRHPRSAPFPEGDTVHPQVQILKGGFQRFGVGVVSFVVIALRHIQNRVGIATVVGRIICRILPQCRNILIHYRSHPSSLPTSFCCPGGSCSGTADTRS